MSEPGIDIEELIPHRGRMRLVQTLTHAAEGELSARSEVLASWPLCDGERVPALVLVELIAQAAATLIGWERRGAERMGGRGLLVGVRKAALHVDEVAVGEALEVDVRTVRKVEAYAVFDGVVRSRSAAIVEATIQAFRPEGGPETWLDDPPSASR